MSCTGAPCRAMSFGVSSIDTGSVPHGRVVPVIGYPHGPAPNTGPPVLAATDDDMLRLPYPTSSKILVAAVPVRFVGARSASTNPQGAI